MKDEFEIDIIDIIRIIKKRYKQVIVFTLAFTFGIFMINILTPKTYMSEATLLPIVEQQTDFNSFMPFLSLSQGLGYENNKIVTILNSRRITEMVVENLNLAELLYGKGYKSAQEDVKYRIFRDASDYLDENSVKQLDKKDGLIHISVIWPDQELSAKICNEYVLSLGNMLAESSLKSSYMILDKAEIPKDKYRPQTIKNTLFGLFAALCVSVFSVFIIEYWDKIKDQI